MAKILVELDDGHVFETPTNPSLDVGSQGRNLLAGDTVTEPGEDGTFFLHPVSRVKRLTIET